jgi:hypothetical protein
MSMAEKNQQITNKQRVSRIRLGVPSRLELSKYKDNATPNRNLVGVGTAAGCNRSRFFPMASSRHCGCRDSCHLSWQDQKKMGIAKKQLLSCLGIDWQALIQATSTQEVMLIVGGIVPHLVCHRAIDPIHFVQAR